MEAGEELVERQDDHEESIEEQEESIEEQETEEEKHEEKSIELDQSEQQPARREAGEVNYRLQVLEEICLEGLEGITLQALWLRLGSRPGYSLGLGREARQFVWQVVHSLPQVSLYRLAEPRSHLVLYDRYQHMDGDLGIVIEPDSVPEDIYPFCLVEDGEAGVRGSCSSYSSRQVLAREQWRDLALAESLGGGLVVVASQEARTTVLLGRDWDPLQVAAITATQWAILERVGRARDQGEVTQGKLSLQFMNENPKTLFYHRKALLSKGLMMKQVHHQKTKGQNFQGTLFHLPRFYVERKPKALVLVRNTIQFLQTRQQGIATYEEVRAHLNLGNSVKKLFKTQEFQRFMKGDVRVAYRTVFPEAGELEWRRKGSGLEKTVRVVQLVEQGVDPEAVFGAGEEEEEEDKRTEQEVLERGGTPAGVLDQGGWLLDRTMMWQAYRMLEGAGAEGLSQQQLGQRLGQGKLEARTICRNLLRRQLVVTVMKDIGRQRVTNYVARRWQHLSHGAVQYRVEKDKNDQLVGAGLKLEVQEEEGREDTPVSSKRQKLAARVERRLKSELRSRVVEEEAEASGLPGPEGDSPINISISSGFQLPDSQGQSPARRKERAEPRVETFRQLRRANTIIEAVRHHQVVDDPTKLYKMIQEQEITEGYGAKMDKKSLMRLLSKLGEEGQVKNIRVVFKHAQKTKILHFVCNPEVSEDNTIIQSAIEQAKMKFNIAPRAAAVVKEEREFLSESVSESVAAMLALEECEARASPARSTKLANQRFGRRYGLQPKFVKMRELHLLLYYLIHGYSGREDLDQGEALKELRQKGMLEDEVEGELAAMRLYSGEVGWRMFIPPLPSHQGWPTSAGWCLMCDVLLRLPLSIFVKLVNITFELPGLQDYLTHPVRRNYLIRALPQAIRNKLLFQRKYIFAVHEVASRLAYIGALQFGPQKLKEKDQVFLYLNQHTGLTDTTSSSPGYHQVEAGRDYPAEDYRLDCLAAVEQYWHRMYEICLFTPLGGSSAVTGQEITLEVMEKKPAMLESLSPRSVSEASLADDGSVPGDGLGAAGLDSSIFAHLKRNWTWNSSESSRRGEAPPAFQLPEGPRAEAREVSLTTGQGRLRVAVSQGPNVKRSTRGQKRKRASSHRESGSSSREVQGGASLASRPAVTRRVVRRKQPVLERKPYYDEKDKAALRLMRKLRVDWSSGEDAFLLLCKVAGSFLCANSRNQMVAYTAVRDLLHTHFPEAQNKTSRACQRRLNYMMKNQTSADNVSLFLEDVRQDSEVVGRFPVPGPGQLSRLENEARLEASFPPLVEALLGKYRRAASGVQDKLSLPGTRAEVEELYSLVYPAHCSLAKRGGQGFSEPSSLAGVQAGVVNSLITSSLCSTGDKRSWAFQLFKIYQQYPDSLLREVMHRLRENKMVSLKKHYNKAKVKEGNYLPLSSAPYQLSVTFAHTFLCRYQYDIYSQAWTLARSLLARPHQYTEILTGKEGGAAAATVELMAGKRMNFRTEVPDQLVVLDPAMAAADESYVRILQRYRELLRNAGSMEKEVTELEELGARGAGERRGRPGR